MMKNKRNFLFVLSLAIVFLLYRADFTVAIAAPQNAEDVHAPEAGQNDATAADMEPWKTDEPAVDAEPWETDEPAAGVEPWETDEPAVDAEPGKTDEPTVDVEPWESDEPAIDAEPGKTDEPAAGAEPWESDEPAIDAEPEKTDEPAVDPEPGEADELAVGSAVRAMKSAVTEEPEESVSSGGELTDWLESHKYTGGTVKLADHIVLDEDYSFYPGALHMPVIMVDTDRYTITVTKAVDLMSDNHLTFSGQPEGKGIFCVEERGLLSMQGITVESKTGALWQEEGAGLAVSDCRVTGSVHYAETPFVIESDPVCVVVEKGQTVNDVLPEALRCRVNRQGEVNSDVSVPLVWNLEGTERQQEERLRFKLQGSFSDAASMEPVRGTVVYNDYPLTFKKVNASMYGNSYIFKGCYTKPEEEFPYTLISEYSFDAENWMVSEEAMVNGTYEGFVIIVDGVRSGRAAHPYIYIRLQCNNNGIEYFSNVLCYAADDLDVMEDIGGSRGGGTSITNPPDKPQEENVGSPTKEEKPEQEEGCGDDPDQADAGGAEYGMPSDAGDSNHNAGQPLHAALADDSAGRVSEAKSSNTEADQLPDTKAGTVNAQQMPQAESPEPGETPALYARMDAGGGENTGNSDPDAQNDAEAVEALSTYGENGAGPAQTLRADNRRIGHMVIAVGVVLLAVAAGTAGFYARSRYSRSGTNR